MDEENKFIPKTLDDRERVSKEFFPPKKPLIPEEVIQKYPEQVEELLIRLWKDYVSMCSYGCNPPGLMTIEGWRLAAKELLKAKQTVTRKKALKMAREYGVADIFTLFKELGIEVEK